MTNRRLLTIALIGPLLVLFLWMVRGLVGALAFGALFTILLWPVEQRVERALGTRKGFGPLIVVLGSVIAIFMPLSFVAVMAVRSFTQIARDVAAMPREEIAAYTSRFYSLIDGFASRLRFNVTHDEVTQAMTDAGQSMLASLGGFFGLIAKATPGTVLVTFVFLTTFYFLLRDGERLREWIAFVLPFGNDDTKILFTSVRDTVRGVMLGSLLVGLVQSSIVLLLLLISDIPGAFVLGVFAFFLSFLPIVGTTPITIGATLYLMANARPVAAIAMVIGILIVALADNVIRPIVQSRSGMHPLLSLVAIFGGLQAFGALGVFLGPVVAAFAVWSVKLSAKLKDNV